MRLPRDLDGLTLVQRLSRLGYAPTRQTGSHVRLTRPADGERPEHHVTVPMHRPLRVGTLGALLGDIAAHLGLSREVLISRLS